ncbi:hypothetical protein [Devosia chinhatensis]|uniref:Uncharacterized protein n=1 Tax=Devosia chinhatensis TaxID=429727 RepID=A0A0F5FIS3_9HYPH|nr:hypothetical protein [Devosia chinhatensis]KKB08794.1 hypothetical protein VE26_01605 [Devosia chinhatensis]
MNLPEIERLVSELLATGDMNEDTRADLERILAEARAGQAHADDVDYLAALHARLLSAGAPETEPSGLSQAGDDKAALHAEIARLRAELEAAHRTIADLRAQIAPEA